MINFNVLGIRSLPLSIFSVALLVGGCAHSELHGKTPICFSPGTVAKTECFYNLEITEIISKSVVRARVPDEVLVYNAKHSSFAALGGQVGSEVNRKHYGDAVYEFNIENPKTIELKPQHTYEFRGIKGKTSLAVVGEARYPDDQGKDQGKDPDLSMNADTELYARHSPQCCMCDAQCQSGCVCPGISGCPWCATADVNTLLAKVSTHKGTVDIRIARESSATSRGVAGRFLALMSGSRTHGTLSVKSIANYAYDQKFAPACVTKRV